MRISLVTRSPTGEAKRPACPNSARRCSPTSQPSPRCEPHQVPGLAILLSFTASPLTCAAATRQTRQSLNSAGARHGARPWPADGLAAVPQASARSTILLHALLPKSNLAHCACMTCLLEPQPHVTCIEELNYTL